MAIQGLGSLIVSVRFAVHYSREKMYGLWLRMAHADDILGGGLIAPKGRAIPIGLITPKRIVAVIKMPRSSNSIIDLGTDLPTTAPWCYHGDTPHNIMWLGDGMIRSEPVHIGRIYIPKRITKHLRVSPKSLKEHNAALWQFSFDPEKRQDWMILDAAL